PHDVFNSSFSFIRLSLQCAGERGEAEGCLPTREREPPCQSSTEVRAENTSVDELVRRQGSIGAFTSGYESNIMASDHGWDILVKKYEPVLMGCLLSNQALLK
ncbi:disrupted in schizophrenia 1 homolog, partial [Gracilinanus agilis]|uniref:disrupted in schizophrenia 1 homolog n=1 Tax=Gracilinanus agilis TaxID=191870 RepID=UPI001CFEA43C